MNDLKAPPPEPVMWEATCGERRVQFEARLWFEARRTAMRALMCGPDEVELRVVEEEHEAQSSAG